MEWRRHKRWLISTLYKRQCEQLNLLFSIQSINHKSFFELEKWHRFGAFISCWKEKKNDNNKKQNRDYYSMLKLNACHWCSRYMLWNAYYSYAKCTIFLLFIITCKRRKIRNIQNKNETKVRPQKSVPFENQNT